MPSIRTFLSLLFSLLVVVALTVSACGGGDDDSDGSNTDPTVTQQVSDGDDDDDDSDNETAEPTEAEDGDDGAGDDDDGDGAADADGPCFLSEGEVEDVIDVSVSASEFARNALFWSCQYSAELMKGMNLTVTFGDDAAEASDFMESLRDGEEISGLGEEAYWSDGSVNILAGTRVVGVEFYGATVDKDSAIALAEVALDRAPESAE